MSEAADRVERCARVMREMEVSPRTEGLLELWAMVCSQMLTTSPNDAADFAELVARLMRD